MNKDGRIYPVIGITSIYKVTEHITLFSQQLQEASAFIIPILRMKKQSPTEGSIRLLMVTELPS